MRGFRLRVGGSACSAANRSSFSEKRGRRSSCGGKHAAIGTSLILPKLFFFFGIGFRLGAPLSRTSPCPRSNERKNRTSPKNSVSQSTRWLEGFRALLGKQSAPPTKLLIMTLIIVQTWYTHYVGGRGGGGGRGLMEIPDFKKLK